MGGTSSHMKKVVNAPQRQLILADQQEQWVSDVTRLMAAVILAAAVLISLGALGGLFDFLPTLPIYILLIFSTAAWWGARRGGWRWAGYFPMLLCFGLGLYSSYLNGFITIFVLFYALAVLLAGMLVNRWMSFIVVGLSMAGYLSLGIRLSGFDEAALTDCITFFFALVGIALLQWYTNTRMQKALAAQINSNETLLAEINYRQHVEAVQQEQEAQLRRLAENTTDMITEVDLNGVMRYVSPSHLAGLGYRPEELMGKNAYEFMHPKDREAAAIAGAQVVDSRQPGRIQVQMQHADGHYLEVEVSGTPLYDTSGTPTGFVLASRDITQEKMAENAIIDSERKFRNIIESFPLGIHMYAIQNDGSLVFSGYNPAADDLLYVDHAQMIGLPIETAFPGLVGTDVPERYREIALLGGQWNSEEVDYDHQPIEGAFEVHAFQTSPGNMVAVFEEITERIRSAEALRASERKFYLAFATSPDAVNINRLADGVFIDANQGFTRLMGFSRDEILGKSSIDLNIWVDLEDRSRLDAALQENGEVTNLEARFRRKNGEIGTGLMSAGIIMVQGEKCILSITRDITERKQAELELSDTHLQLEQAYEATLEGWARALEMRERETADHSRRVVQSTLSMAKEMGIDDSQLLFIQRGALLHDIGKMGVPDEILLKPGRLTADEWVVMRQHTDFARKLLNDIAYLRPSIDIPYCHHEKWDGSGYPQGLRGAEIPLAARIFAVIDVYDALTHARPYRPAWSEENARLFLLEQSGKHFDPAIVTLFLSLI